MQSDYPPKWAKDVVKRFIETCPRGAVAVENLIEYSPEMAAHHLKSRNNRKWESYKWIVKQADREITRSGQSSEHKPTKEWLVSSLNHRWKQNY